MLEVVLLGGLCGVSFALSTLLWHLFVQPDIVVSMFDQESVTAASWTEDSRASSIRALRWAMAVAVFAFGFITGAALAFLAGTSA